METLKHLKAINEAFAASEDKAKFVYELREYIHKGLSIVSTQPVDFVRWVPVDQVQANDYNPNSVAKVEMKLLYTSIKHDGFTQPIVTVKNKKYNLDIGGIYQYEYNNEINKNEKLCNIIENLMIGSLPIRLDLLTPMELSGLQELEVIDIECKSDKAIQIEVENYVNGFKKSGELEKFMIKLDSVKSRSGILQELMTSNTCYHIVCHICESKEKKEKKDLISFYIKLMEQEEEYGLILSVPICESIITKLKQQQLQKNSKEQKMQLEQNVENLDYHLHLEVKDKSNFVIIDGFHRYFTCISNKDILDRNKGMLPIVVINKSINDRMASTVRHNRARGKHSVDGMASMVFSMLENGWEDVDICNELGMEAEELLRLKHITGFSKLFSDIEYKKSWQTKNQILIKKKFNEENKSK